MQTRPTYFQCRFCGAVHRAFAVPTTHKLHQNYMRVQLDVLHGHGGWDEIRHSEVEAWRAGVPHQRESAT